MTYYIQCPKCGDIIETMNFLPEDHVCYGCGHHYKVTRKNSMKKPPYYIFAIIAFVMLYVSAVLVTRVFNYGAPRSLLLWSLWFDIGAGVTVYLSDCLQNKIERSIKRYGMERVRQACRKAESCLRANRNKHS